VKGRSPLRLNPGIPVIHHPVVIVSMVSPINGWSTKMFAISLLMQNLKTNYALIMEADRNPLSRLPPAQRFQTMIYLAIMWTTIFCAASGVWLWYGELIVAHLLIVLGFVLTSVTFASVERYALLPQQVRKRLIRSKVRH
jgi:hypothetical protein